MSKFLLTFYGDDFTGSTDALEQLTLAGVRTVLFIEPPTAKQLKRFPNLQAVGVAGLTRSLSPSAMERELRPAFKKLKALGARHLHYKVCSTFDSSPRIGNIGRVMELGARIAPGPFIPLLVAAPTLGRYTIFGQHFARFGIGSSGKIYRLDRHPSISRHPVTPMTEADLRRHLAAQTRMNVALFDILKLALSDKDLRTAFKSLLAEKPAAVLFDTVTDADLKRIGALLDGFAQTKRPLFSVGSSGIEMALGAHWNRRRVAKKTAPPVKQILVGSGSCSPVTGGQIAWAVAHRFAEVPLDSRALVVRDAEREIQRATDSAVKFLRAGRSVIVHTTSAGPDKRVAAALKHSTATVLGTALGRVLRAALAQMPIQRLCIAGGDTSSFAGRALGIEALEMIAPLTPGAPLCRAHAPGSPADGREIVFKGGQVGAENYFAIVRGGKNL